jgi:hypothetical protein
MSTEIQKLPTLQELFSDVETTKKQDAFQIIMNAQPPTTWIKKHPFIQNYLYLPIDKVEYLLQKIFKTFKIEVIKTGMLMNAVEVTVRVHYKHPVTNEMLFHDGVGAQELQTKKDSGNLSIDMSNVNKGAVMMALPIAKTIAIKDACDHFGAIFGANLNRKDSINYSGDSILQAIDINKIKEQNS